jgi:hypothetical protein
VGFRPHAVPAARQLLWTSEGTQANGDVSSEIRPTAAGTITGFSFSVQAAPTGTMTVKLRKNGVAISTATLATGGNEFSATQALATAVAVRDALTVELTTLAGASLPLLAYIDVG